MHVGLKAEFELVPRSEETSFAVREFQLPVFTSPWHFHPEIELTWILQSSGKRFIGDHIARFHPGDLVLVGSNLPHYWHNDPRAHDTPLPAHSLVIQFREDCLGADFLDRPELEPVRRLLRQAGRGLRFFGPTRDTVTERMLAMRHQPPLERLISLLNIFQLLTQARETQPLSSPEFVPRLDDRAGERINCVYQHVLTHFARPLDHRAIAREAGMSLSAFCHYFKRVTGRTLSDFVREVRIGHARRLLIESNDGVAEIAFASGFESLSNFNHGFRQLSGLSPTQFRHQYR